MKSYENKLLLKFMGEYEGRLTRAGCNDFHLSEQDLTEEEKQELLDDYCDYMERTSRGWTEEDSICERSHQCLTDWCVLSMLREKLNKGTQKEDHLQEDAVRTHVLPEINKVVSGELEKWKSELHFSVDLLFKAMEADGFEVDRDSMETNGWQWDWWMEVKKDGKPFTIGGSGFYGGLSFYPSEKDM